MHELVGYIVEGDEAFELMRRFDNDDKIYLYEPIQSIDIPVRCEGKARSARLYENDFKLMEIIEKDELDIYVYNFHLMRFYSGYLAEGSIVFPFGEFAVIVEKNKEFFKRERFLH